MRNLIKAGWPFLLALLFGVAACGDAGDNDYTEWDADRNNMIDQDEWGSVYSEGDTWNSWDGNRDGYIDNTEWDEGFGDSPNRGVYNNYDLDGDNRLDENEFRSGLFDTWDADRDGYLSEEEYRSWRNS